MAKEQKKERVTLTDAWIEILIENEKLARKRDEKPLTDDEIVKRLGKQFPDRAEKSTVTRISAIRADYNAGRGMFKARYEGEAADGTNRPISVRYGKDGKPAKARARVESGEASGKKKAAAKKPEKPEKPEKPAKEKPAKETAKGKGGKKPRRIKD